MRQIGLTVNEQKYDVTVEDDELLVYVIRERIGLTGTNVGCLGGDCGACTVLVDARSTKSCSVLANTADGAAVTTIEGLGAGTVLDPVQRAFMEQNAFQCGFCLPGMLLVTKELLDGTSDPTDEQIYRALDGNLCRCTGYNTIVEAVRSAARTKREQQETAP
jgi:carbon-monoxide dehydrogenase small subunit